jgi:hypothetical protein
MVRLGLLTIQLRLSAASYICLCLLVSFNDPFLEPPHRMHSHHKKQAPLAFKCPYLGCLKSTRTAAGLKCHKASMHKHERSPSPSPEPEDGTFCTFCVV